SGDQSGNDRVRICLSIGVGELGSGDLRVIAIFLDERDAGFRLGAFACQLGYGFWPRNGRLLSDRRRRQQKQGKQAKRRSGADHRRSPPLPSKYCWLFEQLASDIAHTALASESYVSEAERQLWIGWRGPKK